jgi:hypothetical protein
MDNLENQTGSLPENTASSTSPAPTLDPGSIRFLLLATLVTCIVLSGTLVVYLRWQVKYSQQDLATLQAQAGPVIENFNKIQAPAMREFERKLFEYGKTHSGFAPIVSKYSLSGTPGGAPAVAPSGLTSAPVQAPTPAKK